MIETFFASFFDPIVKRITVAVRRNVFPSLGITVALTLLVLFVALNPWFGSQRAKYWVIGFMIGGADDVDYILRSGAADSNYSPMLVGGAARAGFFTSSDRGIVERWSAEFADSDYINQRFPEPRFRAIMLARERAESHQAPFQMIGLEAVASSPSCEQTRPATGQAYVRADSYLAAQIQPGDSIRLLRPDGLGRPVVATVNKVPDMPRDTDIYLNRVQMVDFLASVSPKVTVRAVITRDKPNQISEDRYPPDVSISCSKG